MGTTLAGWAVAEAQAEVCGPADLSQFAAGGGSLPSGWFVLPVSAGASKARLERTRESDCLIKTKHCDGR